MKTGKMKLDGTRTRKVFLAASLLAILIILSATIASAIEHGNRIAASAAALPAQLAAASVPDDVLMSPEDLAKMLKSPGEKPLIIHVGFYVLYRQGHVPGSEYIGPASQPEPLDKLRKRVGPLSHKKFIVIYCGCCPWSHCPTIKPAYEALHSMGFTNVKVLYIPNNFGQDWLNKGFPVEKGQ